MKNRPRFEVTVPATRFGEGDAIAKLCEHLPGFDLDVMRRAFMDNPRADDPGPNDEGPGLEEGLGIDLCLLKNPFDLGFLVDFHLCVSMIVRLRPEHFDLSNRSQRALFQKCLEILDVLCDAPFASGNIDNISEGFCLHRKHDESQVRRWKQVRARWVARK